MEKKNRGLGAHAEGEQDIVDCDGFPAVDGCREFCILKNVDEELLACLLFLFWVAFLSFVFVF